MNRSFTKWKELGLRSFFALILIGVFTGLSACGGGGGGNGGTGGNGNTNITDNGFGILTISGVDTTQIGKAFSPDTLTSGTTGSLSLGQATPGKVGWFWIVNDFFNDPNMQLDLSFRTVSAPIGEIEGVTFRWNASGKEGAAEKAYLCTFDTLSIGDPHCTGNVVRDTVANTVTFTDVVIGRDLGTFSTILEDPITLNGTLTFTP